MVLEGFRGVRRFCKACKRCYNLPEGLCRVLGLQGFIGSFRLFYKRIDSQLCVGGFRVHMCFCVCLRVCVNVSPQHSGAVSTCRV